MSTPEPVQRAHLRTVLIVSAALFLSGVALGLLWINTYMVR